MKEEAVYPQALLGFRAWYLDRGLYSMGLGAEAWTSSIKQAVCKRGFSHAAPAPDCSCGLYAFYDLQEILSHRKGTLLELGAREIDTPVTSREKKMLEDERHCLALGDYIVIGAVAARGRVQLHWNGFRAEEMQLLSLLVTQKQAGDPWLENCGLLLHHSFRDFEEDAKRQAASLPVAARPEPPLSSCQMKEVAEVLALVKNEEDYLQAAKNFNLDVHELSDIALHLGLEPGW